MSNCCFAGSVEIVQVLSTPWRREVTALELESEIGSAGAEGLAASRPLARLSSLIRGTELMVVVKKEMVNDARNMTWLWG